MQPSPGERSTVSGPRRNPTSKHGGPAIVIRWATRSCIPSSRLDAWIAHWLLCRLGLGHRLVPERRHLSSSAQRVDHVAAVRLPIVRDAHIERDNIPVVSWLLLRGRCRTCKARISGRNTRWWSWPAQPCSPDCAARFGYRWDLPPSSSCSPGSWPSRASTWSACCSRRRSSTR